MRVLSWDPGQTTGWCYQNPQKILSFGETTDLKTFLKEWDLKAQPVDYVVVEGYRIRQGTVSMNVGIPLVTVENIGRIKYWSELNDIPVQEYLPDKKPTQWKATGVKVDKSVPKNQTHRLDAFNHGRFFLIEKKLAPTALEEQMRKDGLL